MQSRIIIIGLLITFLSACASTQVSFRKNPDTGDIDLIYHSPKDYGSIEGKYEVDSDGKLRSVWFKAEGVENAAAKNQADSFGRFIESLERAYTRTPLVP